MWCECLEWMLSGFYYHNFFFNHDTLVSRGSDRAVFNAAGRYIIKRVSTVAAQIPNRLGNFVSRLHNVKTVKRELGIVERYRELGNKSKICVERSLGAGADS